MAKAMAMGQNFSVLAAWGMLVLCMAASGVAAARQVIDHKHATHNVTFFVHEAINTGSDATGFIVAGPGGETSVLKQGSLVVVDNIITETANPKSKQLGKFQGLYVLDGSQKYRVEVTVIIDQPGDLIETTYEILGQRPSFNAVSDRQLAVVAGTGVFLGQKGYALADTVYQKLVGTKGAQYNIQKWTLVVGK